jgi:hypothetical protein
MILHKAKRIDTGEWVMGFYLQTFDPTKEVNTPASHFIFEGVNIKEAVQINPSTLCQQVRGTEFFVGDEFANPKDDIQSLFYIQYDDKLNQWWLMHENGSGITFADRLNIGLKPTGKNKHDDE